MEGRHDSCPTLCCVCQQDDHGFLPRTTQPLTGIYTESSLDVHCVLKGICRIGMYVNKTQECTTNIYIKIWMKIVIHVLVGT